MGLVLPPEVQEKLSHSEEEYFKKHSASLKSYMSRMDLDLAVVSSLCICVLSKEFKAHNYTISYGGVAF